MQFSFFSALGSILADSGFASFLEDPRSLIMILISFVLLYMGIGKRFEPLLLIPIAFGMLLANFPLTGLLNAPGRRLEPRHALGLLSGCTARDLSVHHLSRHRRDD